MLTLFHGPKSRSSRIVTLIDEMGIADRVAIRPMNIVRMDGSGGRDPANPHPEGKVPALLTEDGSVITETAAIMLYLTQAFPDSGMAPAPGTPGYGAFLTWMVWYGSVMEPVLVVEGAGLVPGAVTGLGPSAGSDHPSAVLQSDRRASQRRHSPGQEQTGRQG